jgi:hypothetical protein
MEARRQKQVRGIRAAAAPRRRNFAHHQQTNLPLRPQHVFRAGRTHASLRHPLSLQIAAVADSRRKRRDGDAPGEGPQAQKKRKQTRPAQPGTPSVTPAAGLALLLLTQRLCACVSPHAALVSSP